jgi:hypothetical protein
MKSYSEYIEEIYRLFHLMLNINEDDEEFYLLDLLYLVIEL